MRVVGAHLLHLLDLLLHGELLLLVEEGLIVHWLLLLLATVAHLLLLLLHLVVVSILINLLDHAKLVRSHLKVRLLRLVNVLIDTIDLELVGVNLSLIVLKLTAHFFELLSTLFKI